MTAEPVNVPFLTALASFLPTGTPHVAPPARNRGGHWATSTARSILRNHVYTSTLVWNRLDFSDARREGGGPK